MTLGDGSSRMVAGQITHGGAGFLMIGTLWLSGGEGDPIQRDSLWGSADGRDWHELGQPEGLAGVGIVQLTTAADGSYVIYGRRAEPGVVGTIAVALRSSNGAAWEELAAGLPRVLYVQAIERGPGGYLLVGGQGADANPTLWLSADGLAWELVHEFEQTEQWVQIQDADGGEEGYVVLGRRIQPNGPYRRFAFASADGRNWSNSDQPFGPDDQAYVPEANVSSLGPDWVATLGRRDAPLSTWFSANGLDWSEVGSLEADPNASAGVFEEIGGNLIFSPGQPGPFEGFVGVWSSRDGANWAAVDFGAEIWLGGIAEAPGIIAVTGTVPAADFTSTAGVWMTASK